MLQYSVLLIRTDPKAGLLGNLRIQVNDILRKQILAWLEEYSIPWQPCGPYASTNGFRSYWGEIYLDIPFDETDERYRLVRDYLENPDGTMRYENIRFYYYRWRLR